MNALLDHPFSTQLIAGGFALIALPLLSILGVALTQVPSRE